MKRLLVIWLVAITLIAARPVTTANTLSAVVNVDGSLARGLSVTSSRSLEVDGQYVVTFNRDVSNCTYVATGGSATSNGPDDAVVYTVAPWLESVNGVFVQEWDGVLARDSYSEGFHLVVVC